CSRKKAQKKFGFGWRWNLGAGTLALASLAIIALMIALNPSQQNVPQVAINNVAPSATPAPSPKSEPPQQQQPVAPKRRPAPVREPKPGEQFAAIPESVRPADSQTMTALHFEKAETLLRAFRNVRLDEPGAAEEVSYERKRAKQMIYQNMILRREADAAG